MATIPERNETAETPRQKTRDEGIAKILESAGRDEGSRVLIFGRTRYGKSTFAVDLVEEMLLAGIASTAIIHDPKYPDRQQYDGIPVTAITSLGPMLKSGHRFVFRPPSTAAEAAAASRILTESGEPTVLLLDETRRALAAEKVWADSYDQDGRANKGPKNCEWHFLEAGGVRGSVVLLVQVPRSLPGHAIDSAQRYVIFGLAGPSLRYMVDAKIVPDDAVETVKRLPPGAFVVLSPDDDWDGCVYYSPLTR